MKLKIKKYIYFLNDITNLLLEKDQLQAVEQARTLRLALIIVSAALLLSIILNIYFMLVA